MIYCIGSRCRRVAVLNGKVSNIGIKKLVQAHHVQIFPDIV
jgi:hypothetical protein